MQCNSTLAVDTVSQDRARWKSAKVKEPLEGPLVASPYRVVDIGQVLSHVDVHDRVELSAEVGCNLQGLVGDRERGM